MPDPVYIKTHDELTATTEILCSIATSGRLFPSSNYQYIRGTALAAVRHLENRGFTAYEDESGGVVVEDYSHRITLRWLVDEEGNESYIVHRVEKVF